MAKVSGRKDAFKYPSFIYDIKSKSLIECNSEYVSDSYTAHHFIRTQWIRNHKREVEEYNLLRFQKIIFLPTFVWGLDDMHGELHGRHSKFEEKWGIHPDYLLFDEKNWREKYL